MPAETDYAIFDYNGAAVQTNIVGNITDSDTSITVADGSSLPLASGGKFTTVRINEGEGDEECIAYGPRVDNVLTNCIRGFDDTAAVSHQNGATITHGSSAKDAREANAVANGIGGLTGAQVAQTVTAGATTEIATWSPTIAVLDGDTRTQTVDLTRGGTWYYHVGDLVFFQFHRLITMSGGTGAGGVGITLPIPADLGSTSDIVYTFSADCQNATARANLRDNNTINVYQEDTRNTGHWFLGGGATWFRITGWYKAS